MESRIMNEPLPLESIGTLGLREEDLDDACCIPLTSPVRQLGIIPTVLTGVGSMVSNH